MTTQQPARERILATAADLFYRHGLHAVGIDQIVAESGVAKMTLYRHFPSKDALIAAYLERANASFWGWLDSELAPVATPRQRLLVAFEAVARLARAPQCLGCAFQATAAEFPALDHPGHQVALVHKRAVIARLRSLAEQANLRDPEALAEQLLLLMDGAWAAARMFGPDSPDSPVRQAARAAAVLIEAHEARA